MRTLPAQSPLLHRRQDLPWRDVAMVFAVTLLSVALSAHFELNEALYSLTRHGEYLQLDEWPIGMLVLSMSLIWLSWKRYRQARRELLARQLAEATLAGVLLENRNLAKENLRIQEIERKHLARELHDETGQYLNAIKLDAVSICESEQDAASCTEAAHSIIRSVDHVHGAVSDMIGRLRPAGLDELGLVAAIEHCIDHWRRRLPDTRFQLSVSGNWEGLDEQLNLTIYRLIQEALTNIFKHAQARQVAVLLEHGPETSPEGDELQLTIADDGRGMEAAVRSSRYGIHGMRERVSMTGGRFMLESAPGQGLKLEARWPLQGEV